jgi:hypothetical protein
MNNKVNLTEEMNRMRNLFGYKAGKVISEQEITSSNTLNEQDYTGINTGTNNNGKGINALSLSQQREQLQVIADKKKEALANNNMVTDNGVKMRWTDYIVKNGIQPSEIKAAEQLNATANTDLKKQQDRYRNIVKTIDSVDDNGIIQISTPSLKGKSWVDYANQYKITQDEINKAREYVKTAPEVKTEPVVDNVPNTREQAIGAMYKLVDKDGIIRAPGSQMNNVKWEDYVKTYKVTNDEISKLKGNAKVVPLKTVAQIQIPKVLVDVNGVKKFQEWLNTQDPTWVNGKTLELNPKRGYGRFGPLTSASWNKLKDIYLKEIGSLQANQKVVANPELATTAVAPAQAAKITEPAPAPAPAAGLTAGQQTNLNRIGQQLQTPEQKRAAELAQKYGQK